MTTITYWHFLFLYCHIWLVSTIEFEHKNSGNIANSNLKAISLGLPQNTLTPSDGTIKEDDKLPVKENNKMSAINVTLNQPLETHVFTKRVNHFKKHHHRNKRHHNNKHFQRKHRSASPSDLKSGAIFAYSTDPREMKSNIPSPGNNALKTMINLTRELINLEKISASLLSRLPEISHNIKHNVSGLMMSNMDNINQEKQNKSILNNTGYPEFLMKSTSIKELPGSYNKSANESSHLYNKHSSISTDPLINTKLPSMVKNDRSSNLFYALFKALNAPQNTQHQSASANSTDSIIKNKTNSSSSDIRQFIELHGAVDESTQTSSIIIINTFGFFDDDDDVPFISEHIENHKVKPLALPIFDIMEEKDNNNNKHNYNNFSWPEDLWRQLNLFDAKSETIKKSSESLPFINDQHRPWILRDDIQTAMASNIHVSNYMRDKKMAINNETPKISDRKNNTKSSKKAIHAGNLLSTFYISLTVCGFLLVLGVFLRRLSMLNRGSFSTVGDSILLSQNQSAMKPLMPQ